MTEEGLVEAAAGVMARAYAPYSGYHVGAAILTEDGTVVTACNVENVSYGLTVCAERAAVARAVAEGHRRFEAIAIVTDGSESVAPCGACRQVLAEFAPQIEVVMQGSGERVVRSLSDLFPEPFQAPAGWRKREEGGAT